jgi:hypothetical protein
MVENSLQLCEQETAFTLGLKTMTQPNNEFRVHGLTPLQFAELEAALAPVGGSVLSKEVAPMQGDRHGEPTLIAAAIQLAPAVIGAVAVWLAKQKERNRRKFRYSKIGPDGTEEKISLDLSSYEEGAGNAPAIETYMRKVFDAAGGK